MFDDKKDELKKNITELLTAIIDLVIRGWFVWMAMAVVLPAMFPVLVTNNILTTNVDYGHCILLAWGIRFLVVVDTKK